MKKLLKWIGIIFVVLIVIGIISDGSKTPEEKAAEAQAREQRQAKLAEEQRVQLKRELDSLPAYTASEIVIAYSENTVLADQIFKGKKFKVSGVIIDINTDFRGNPYITLQGGVNQFMEPQFSFEKSESSQLAKLRRGMRVTLVCTGRGDVAKTPMSGACSLL